jgi:hypothetical protein
MTFDEVEIVRPVDEAPDLSDLALVTLNAETSDGRQYSMVWTAEEGPLSIVEDGFYVSPAVTKWTFVLVQKAPIS